ncbi:MAG: adenylate/guanylate cyclase domain-containing protein [Myxococcales bacterium]|nr:adenylate/guanylate cyclase domain-containing protein [Myxococcales bacterium]
MKIDTVETWLLEVGAAVDSVDGFANGLRDFFLAADLPIGFFNLGMFVLHPEVAGIAFSGAAIDTLTRVVVDHNALVSPIFLNSPVRIVTEERRSLSYDLTDVVACANFPILAEFRAKGFQRYEAWPLVARHGPCSVLSLALTTQDRSAIAVIQRALPLLSVVLELHAARFLKQILLRTYIGERSAREVLAGRFRRGESRGIQAVLWLSDIRGFTQLSQHFSGPDVVRWLDQVFDAQAAPVEQAGGEILKFIGDAMLVIFPVDQFRGQEEACRVALAAAREAQCRVEAYALNAATEGRPALKTVIAIHVGAVVYGNVGSKNRLDFTVIGDAVNRVSRIESVAHLALSGIVLSAEFADSLTEPVVRLGQFPMKGYDEPIDVFTVGIEPAP